MLSIAHGVTGALIFTLIPNPIIATPLTIAAHYAQDFVPHWDVGQGLTKHKKSLKSAFLQELFFDFPGSLILVYLIFQHGQPFSINPYLGWFFALLPDFVEFPFLFLKWRFYPIDLQAKLHAYVHRSTSHVVWGMLPQIATILLAILIYRSL